MLRSASHFATWCAADPGSTLCEWVPDLRSSTPCCIASGTRISYTLSRQRLIERPQRPEDHRRAGRDRVAIGPFLRRMALAGPARHEHHRRRADAAHIDRVVTGAARQIDLAEAEIARALTQRRVKIVVSGDRRS